VQNSPSRRDSTTPPARNFTYIGIDPGLIKCGYAVVSVDGVRLALEIVPTANLTERLCRDVESGAVGMVCLGNATKSDMVLQLIRTRWPQLPVTVVDERNTSLLARLRYYQDHPPKGLWRFVPRGLLVPKAQLDGYAALLIIERYRSACSTGGCATGTSAMP
jgi:RNase H-fold protein (predicted Holliday junction resolvase)